MCVYVHTTLGSCIARPPRFGGFVVINFARVFPIRPGVVSSPDRFFPFLFVVVPQQIKTEKKRSGDETRPGV